MTTISLNIPVELINLTYMVRHNPNCPMPYEVRLTGMGLLTEHWHRQNKHKDDVGYGLTLYDAASAALHARAERLAIPGRKAKAKMFRDLWEGI